MNPSIGSPGSGLQHFAKEVRTSKFKSQVVEDKTKYNRKKEKTLHEMAMEGYEEEQRMYEDEEYLESLKDKL